MPRAAVVGDQFLPFGHRAIVGSDQGHAGSTRARPPGTLEPMTETLTYKQLRRSRSERMVAGVSGGLGRYFDVNPVLYRVGFVVLALLGGAGILIYLAAALVIPDEGQEQSIVEQALRERRSRPWRLLGLALVLVSAVVLISQGHFWDGQLRLGADPYRRSGPARPRPAPLERDHDGRARGRGGPAGRLARRPAAGALVPAHDRRARRARGRGRAARHPRRGGRRHPVGDRARGRRGSRRRRGDRGRVPPSPRRLADRDRRAARRRGDPRLHDQPQARRRCRRPQLRADDGRRDRRPLQARHRRARPRPEQPGSWSPGSPGSGPASASATCS